MLNDNWFVLLTNISLVEISEICTYAKGDSFAYHIIFIEDCVLLYVIPDYDLNGNQTELIGKFFQSLCTISRCTYQNNYSEEHAIKMESWTPQ